MKKMISFLLTIVMLFSLCGTSFAAESAAALREDTTGAVIRLQIGNSVMTVNGREKPIDESGTVPIIKNGYTLLPIRAVVEAMGGTVEWNGASQTAMLSQGDSTIKLTIDSKTAFLNGAAVNLDAAPELVNGITMLPIRFIAESFGFDVAWDGTNQAVTITEKEVSPLETSEAGALTKNEPHPLETGDILIAYFSRAGENYNVGYIEKGNTEIVAEIIAEQTSGTLFQIQTVTPYPEGYEDTKVIATREKESNARPALTGKVESMDLYDIIFLGYPIWYGTNPMAVNSFLEGYDLSGKTIIPFSTNEGSGFGGSISDIKKLCPNSTFLEGLAVRGSDAKNSQNSVISWLDKIDIKPTKK